MKKQILEIYTIDSDYIKFLSKYDSNVMTNFKTNSSTQRPYVGIVLKLDNFLYFAPLTHDGKKWIKYKDHIVLDKGKLGAIKIGRMVPILDQYETQLLSIVIRSKYTSSLNKRDKQYGILLQKQYRLLNYEFNAQIVCNKIKSFYKGYARYKYNCNFKQLEKGAIDWAFSYRLISQAVTNLQNYVKNNIY